MHSLPPTPVRRRNAWLGVLAAALLAPAPLSAQDAKDQPAEGGLIITVPNPISGPAVERIKQEIANARNQPARNIRKVVFDFNPDGKEAATRDYGTCYNLAKEIRALSLNGVTTIAFVHSRTTGHTVLPVLACTDLVMSSDARIGEVVEPNAPPPPRGEVDYYLELAGTRSAIVHKMLDRNVEVVSGVQRESVIYFDARRKDEPQFQNVFNPQPVRELSPGTIELYSAEKAVKYGLCKVIKETRQEVAELYQVSFLDDGLQGRSPKACKIELVGQVDDALREKLRRQLDEAKARKENTIFFVIDCSGGSLEAARGIADDILELAKLDEPIRTIAYVPGKAPDLAAFPALACSQLVMYKGPNDEEAVLGDFETYLANAKKKKDSGVNPDFIKRNLIEVVKDRHPTVLVEAMFDAEMALVRARNDKTGERRLMTRQEAQAAGKDWVEETTIKERGQLLKLTATRAKEVRVAAQTVSNPDVREVFSAYAIEAKDVRDAKPHWLDSFAAFLRRTEVSILLILIGIGGLILEMKVPGMMIPGITAAVCFVLFFWSQSQMSGQIIYLAILLFILGLVLIGLEIFVLPGFGIPGIAGILLVIGGLGLATLDRIPQSSEEWGTFGGRVMQYGLTMVAAAALTLMFARYLPKIPYANRLMLIPPTDKPDALEPVVLPGFEQAAALLGATGTATSMLRPAGMAKFGEVFVDVVTDGDFVQAGTPIQVIEVEGTRIVVKPL